MKIWHSNKNNWIHNILSFTVRLHLVAVGIGKYTGFDKWKCSWSNVTINKKSILAKWHGTPKNNEHIGGQPKLDLNERQGIVSKNLANC